LRESVRIGTRLGAEAKKYMDAGCLVPDGLIIEMMKARLREDDAHSGFLLDGFPRTVAQASALDSLLSEMSIALDAVILLDISDEEVVRRLASRRVCVSCGFIYNAASRPPRTDGVCDSCGGRVIQRDDDNEAVIRNRLSVYHEQTAPLVEYYESRGVLARVDGAGGTGTARAYLGTLAGAR